MSAPRLEIRWGGEIFAPDLVTADGTKGCAVAEVFGADGDPDSGRWDPDALALARRIVASGPLLAVLKECVAWMDAPHRATPLQASILADARAVIEKAERGA